MTKKNGRAQHDKDSSVILRVVAVSSNISPASYLTNEAKRVQLQNPVDVGNKGVMLLVLLDSAIVLTHNAE